MTKTLLTALAVSAALISPGFAQVAAVDQQLAESLKTAITQNGFDCVQVVFVEPVGNDGARVTCQKTAGSDATGNYIFAVSNTGLTVSEE